MTFDTTVLFESPPASDAEREAWTKKPHLPCRSRALDIFAEGSAMGLGTQGIYTLPGSPVTTLADLRGQTVAINAPDNILYLLTASVLIEHGVSPTGVHFAGIPFTEMPAELQSGAVSAAVLPEPFASDAEQAQGGVPLTDLDQGATAKFDISSMLMRSG